jgi:hypothetical protein
MRVTVVANKEAFGVVIDYLMVNYGLSIGFEESMVDRNHSDYRFTTNPGTVKYLLETDGSLKIRDHMAEQRELNRKSHRITTNLQNEELDKVLDQIVAQMRGYQWKIDHGVINIYPSEGRDKRFEELMGMRIKNFTLEKGKTVEDISVAIKALPEFSSFMKSNKLTFTGIRNGADFVLKAQYGRTTDAMDFSNLTFNQLLNKIARTKGGGWSLRWKGVWKASGWEDIDIDI